MGFENSSRNLIWAAIIIERFAYRFDNLFGPFVGIIALFDFLIKGKE
jgi:hypothetical protein